MVQTITKIETNPATTPVVAISDKVKASSDSERARPILTRNYAPPQWVEVLANELESMARRKGGVS